MGKLMKTLLGVVAIVLATALVVNFLPNDTTSTTATASAPTSETPPQKNEPAPPPVKQESSATQAKPTPSASAAPKMAETFKEGVDYRALDKPVLTDVNKGEIEIAEVFWYGCPHCYNLEPIVAGWKKTLAPNSILVRRPGFFGPNLWQTHAQLYYAVRNMGIEDKVHDGIFNEIQNRRNMLKDVDAMADFLNKQYGVDKQAFTDEFNSFGVNHLLQQSFAKLQGYNLTGVPALIIDGRYVVEPGMAGSLNRMPIIADYLIEKVREERTSAAQ